MDIAVDNPRFQRLRRSRVGSYRLTVGQIDHPIMQRAANGIPGDDTLRQWSSFVRTFIDQSKNLIISSTEYRDGPSGVSEA